MKWAIKLSRPLYAHQEEAIRKVKDERNIVIATGTGSGKTRSLFVSDIEQFNE